MRFLMINLLLILGCQKSTTQETPPQLAAFGYLILGNKTQEIVIEPIGPDDSMPQNLEVFVIGEVDTVYFYSQPDTPALFQDTTAQTWLIPSSLYMLRVKAQNELIYGETTTPGLFHIVTTTEIDTFYLGDTLPHTIIWSKSEGARLYFVHFLSDTISIFNVPIEDTIINLDNYSGVLPTDSLIKIQVSALDNNAYNYEINGLSSMENGEGVFGSIVQDSVWVYLKES